MTIGKKYDTILIEIQKGFRYIHIYIGGVHKPQKESFIMGIANKYNHGAKFNFVIPENADFISLAELHSQHGNSAPYLVKVLYINNKSRYGASPVAVIITDGKCYRVNLPKHLTNTVEMMRVDPDVIEAVNNDTLGFSIYPYDKDGKEYYSITWLDVEV